MLTSYGPKMNRKLFLNIVKNECKGLSLASKKPENTSFKFTTNTVGRIKNEQKVIINEVQQNQKQNEVLGKCPLCGHGIIEGTKGYGCSNWRSGCKYVIWKNDKFLTTMKKSRQKQW